MMSPIGLGWFFQTWGRRARNAFGYLELHWTHLRTHGYQLLCFFFEIMSGGMRRAGRFLQFGLYTNPRVP